MTFTHWQYLLATTALLLSIGRHGSDAFAPSPNCRRISTGLFGIRCENKYYQLEEMEDKETATTELFLKEDGTIDIGDTDGPKWDSAKGTWNVIPGTDAFSMTISKTFGAGAKGKDVGEFVYTVARTYVGDMTHVGESVAITGVMKDGLVGEQKNVGFFNMIDGTDIRKDARPDARKGTDKEPSLFDKSDASSSHKGAEGFLVGQPRASNLVVDNSLPFGWEEYFDPAQGRNYYVDTTTGNTQWERPQMKSIQSAMATPSSQSNTNAGLPPGWEEHFDPAQNRPCYVQTSTGVTQWEYPSSLQQPAMAPTSSASASLPAGWEEHFDAAQNRPYYFNTARGLSQWERPQ